MKSLEKYRWLIWFFVAALVVGVGLTTYIYVSGIDDGTWASEGWLGNRKSKVFTDIGE